MAENEMGSAGRRDVAILEASRPPSTLDELSVEQVVAQVQKIQRLMRDVMIEGVHYGTIPGTPKPTLYKAGAEILCLMFRLDPQYSTVEKVSPDGHKEITSTCTLYHIPTGMRMGSGMGECSTRETKYAFRKGARACPACGKEDTIVKGKVEYGGGWLCFKKKDGCGAKFRDGDASIEGQSVDRVANPNVADEYNTVLKMSNKRSLNAAVLNVTAASDIFTQDLEDRGGNGRNDEEGDDDERKDAGNKSKPTDKASPEQRQALMKMANEVLGLEESLRWVKTRMKDLDIKRNTDTTVAQFQQLTQELAEMRAADQSLDKGFDEAHPPAPEEPDVAY
jgi:hypothetical protein